MTRKNSFVKINIDAIGIFRAAAPSDIKEGNVVFLVGDNNYLYRFTIYEVIHPDDDFKAFVADDGCRYGLMDLHVLKSNGDLHQQIETLTDKLRLIKEIL